MKFSKDCQIAREKKGAKRSDFKSIKIIISLMREKMNNGTGYRVQKQTLMCIYIYIYIV